jgi:hypothetical protein
LYQLRLIRRSPYHPDSKSESPQFKTEQMRAVKQETLVISIGVVKRIQAARSWNLCFNSRRGGDFSFGLAVQMAMLFTEHLPDGHRTIFRGKKAVWLIDHSDPYSEG